MSGNIQEIDRVPTHSISSTETSSSESIVEVESGSLGCCFKCCDPRGNFHRFVVLFFMCFLGFGSYFCYDNPAALESHIQADLDLSYTEYTMFYSLYSWPNVFLCFIGGFLIDRVFGICWGANIYMGLTFLGQIIFAGGSYFNLYWLMLIGRFIFGIGAESLAVAQNNYAVLWFKGKELNMVFGLQLSFARVGSAVNFLIMDPIYQFVHKSHQGPQGLGIVLFIAAATCLLSLLCSLILGFFDKRAESLLRRNENSTNDVVKLTDVKDFRPAFWLITIICVAYYVAIFPFIGLAQGFFKTKFDTSDNDANSIISTVYILSAVVSPVLGLLIDKIGKNIVWITTAIMITIFSHSLMAFSSLNPLISMLILGVAYSCLASSLWPLVSLIIPEHQLGTAYGVCQAIQNLGLAVFSLLTGIIVEHHGYTVLEIFFISSLIVALISTIVLWIFDFKTKGTLNLTPRQRLELTLMDRIDKEKVINNDEGTSVGIINEACDIDE